jgi:hypothetical protein
MCNKQPRDTYTAYSEFHVLLPNQNFQNFRVDTTNKGEVSVCVCVCVFWGGRGECEDKEKRKQILGRRRLRKRE